MEKEKYIYHIKETNYIYLYSIFFSVTLMYFMFRYTFLLFIFIPVIVYFDDIGSYIPFLKNIYRVQIDSELDLPKTNIDVKIINNDKFSINIFNKSDHNLKAEIYYNASGSLMPYKYEKAKEFNIKSETSNSSSCTNNIDYIRIKNIKNKEEIKCNINIERISYLFFIKHKLFKLFNHKI